MADAHTRTHAQFIIDVSYGAGVLEHAGLAVMFERALRLVAEDVMYTSDGDRNELVPDLIVHSVQFETEFAEEAGAPSPSEDTIFAVGTAPDGSVLVHFPFMQYGS